MSFWSKVPFIRIVLAFGSGIITAHYYQSYYWVATFFLCLFLLIYLLIVNYFPQPAFSSWSPYVGCLGLSCIFLSGYLYLLAYKKFYAPTYLMHQENAIEAYAATAIEDAQEKEGRLTVTVAIGQARICGQWQQLQAKVRLCVGYSQQLDIRYGDVFLIKGSPHAVPSPRNPHEFDYSAYLLQDNVYYQHFTKHEGIMKLHNKPPNYWQAILVKIRRYCTQALVQGISGAREQAIALALVLGLKDELDLVIKDAYASAGTMHVLAVSGLHVGILYTLLNILCVGLRKPKLASGWRTAFVLMGLWLYAGITGLAPSVLRATVMCSFVVIAHLLGRQSNIYNSLAASAFVLLLGRPYLVFSVSFQLSYLAVLGIVYLQPRIYAWFRLKNWLMNQLWLGTSVSLAAQLATTPISLYYFHQFPNYFLVANWVVVPAAFLMLSLGLLVLLTSFWSPLSTFLAGLLAKIIWLVNQFVLWIGNLPGSKISNIYFAPSSLVLWYMLLIMLLIFFESKRFQYLVVASGLAVLLGIGTMQALLSQQMQQGVVLYSINGHQVVNFIKGPTSMVCTDDHFGRYPKKYTYHVQPSQLAMGIKNSNQHSFEEAIGISDFPLQAWRGVKIGVWGNKKFIFINKAPACWSSFTQKVHTDFLVIEANAVTNLQELMNQFDMDTLIIGASNCKQLALALTTEAQQCSLNYHSLPQQGAFIAYW